MASGQVGVQIGISGKAFYRGIPGMTVTWTGFSGASRSATIFNTMEKGIDADIATSYGNAGEWLAQRRRNKCVVVTIEAKPIGANAAAAKAIVDDVPIKGDLCTINDGTTTTTYIIDSKPVASYTPENEAVIRFDLKCYLNDDNTVITPTVLAES